MVRKAEKLGSTSARASRVEAGKVIGNVTRGTTGTNRLRRVDRWIASTQSWRLRAVTKPLVIDLGYGAHPWTAVELYQRLKKVQPSAELLGLEIEADRVRRAAKIQVEQYPHESLSFAFGGFEIPAPRPPSIIRAFNVLRQYEESDVPTIWERLTDRLAPEGALVEGTCDELGRRAAWVLVDVNGPISLTISMRFGGFDLPSDVAERLPKALIHRNVAGQRIHQFLQELDQQWSQHSSLAPFGNRQRWVAMCQSMKEAGWPIIGGASRWRLGELSVEWSAVAPG